MLGDDRLFFGCSGVGSGCPVGADGFDRGGGQLGLGRARLAADTALGSQERLKREIAALLEEVARMHPVVLCFDDMHWADPSTTDLIAYLARRID